MEHFRVTGKKPLKGSITISGRKNAALKLIAASVLSNKPVTLYNVPNIGDVKMMLQILKELGGKVTSDGSTVTILNDAIHSQIVPYDLGRKLRASLVFVGPLLARFGTAVFPHPGGCVIGKRSIVPHLEGFQKLGATINFDGEKYTISKEKLTGATIYMQEKSVTGTENIIMAAVRSNGTTTILNAAEETHICNLCDLLRAMGFSIEGDGTSRITVFGSPEIDTITAEATILPDEIEVGTFAIAAAVTQGDLFLHKVGTYEQLVPILTKLSDFNVQFEYNEAEQTLHVLPSYDLRASDIQTNPWPGFPADLQSPFTILATQAKGTSLIHDWMYEGRLYFVDLLTKMGANIITCDPHRAIVNGPTPLQQSTSTSPDLRAGAALVIAALAAEGTSTIEYAELIDRGYARLEEKLRSVGAEITREESNA